jgi:ribosome-associated protein
MDIRKLQRVVVDGLEDLKAQHIVVFNTEHLSALFERVIIASGTSNRQTKALASSVRDAVKQAGFPVPRTEGEANGEWIIVDCGAAVVHVMQPTIRTYYHLEEIWGDKPVNIKLASSAVKLVKAAEPEAPVKKPAAKKQAKAVAKKAPAGRPPARAPVKKAAAAKTSPARKAPAKKVAAPAGRVVTRVVGVKKPAAKKAAARPIAAKKAPARKTTARG